MTESNGNGGEQELHVVTGNIVSKQKGSVVLEDHPARYRMPDPPVR